MATRRAAPKGIRAPRRFDREYERRIRRVWLNPWLAEVRRRLERLEDEYLDLREAFRNIPKDPALAEKTAEEARKHIIALERYHRKRFLETVYRWWGIDGSGIMSQATVRPLMARFITDNVNLITKLDDETRAQMQERVGKAIRETIGDRQAIAQAVRDEMGKQPEARVRLIARDQTSKAIGNLNHVRQKEAGIERYVWSTSKDERVRPTHQVKEGMIFRWDIPPDDTGHPGHDYQCRCVAIPRMPPAPRGEQV